MPEDDGQRVRRSRRCAAVDGFSIHANTQVAANNRVGLEHLCRYGMRPPFSHERLSITCDGKVLLALRKPWPTEGGVSALCFEPVQFLRRLTPLIPPPYCYGAFLMTPSAASSRTLCDGEAARQGPFAIAS